MNLELRPNSRQPKRTAWSRDKLVRERAIALGSAIAPTTSITYSSALQSYINFCQMHDFSLDPTTDTLSFYVVFMSHHVSPRTVDSYLSGICNQLESYYPDVRKARNAPIVAKSLLGMKRLRSRAVKRRRPISIDDIRRIVLELKDSKEHDDALFLAQVLTGFFALMRCGELVWPDAIAKQDDRKITWRHTVKLDDSHYEFLLPGHKADRFFEGSRIIIQRLDGPEDPLHPFRAYLGSRDTRFQYKPELWLRADGSIPTYSWFTRKLAVFFPDDDLIGGQSLRAGGATRLAELGATDDRIQAAGRWSSDAFRIYIRKNPILLQSLITQRPAFQPRE